MLPNKIKAIIFDVDGTLLDSLGAWAQSDRIFLEEQGIPYDKALSEKLRCMHYAEAAEFINKTCCPTLPLEFVMSRIGEIIKNKYLNEIKVKPDASRFIAECSRKGIKMCAATSNIRELAEGGLKSGNILSSLEFILTCEEAGSGKSDPGIFLKCAERLGTFPCETAVFEDSFHAALSASSAGFYTVGVLDAYGTAEHDKLREICSITIESFGELL